MEVAASWFQRGKDATIDNGQDHEFVSARVCRIGSFFATRCGGRRFNVPRPRTRFAMNERVLPAILAIVPGAEHIAAAVMKEPLALALIAAATL